MADAFVVVIGLGGVGSHCAHMLLRSGVSRMRLVDFDQVSLSSLNRHAVATREDVGTSKSSCLVSHFKKIYPEAVLEDRNMMYEKAVENELLGDDPDFVVDCIDNIDTKVELLAACVRRGIPVLACGGAGAKCDPTRIRVVDVAGSIADPLARAVRHRLKRDHGIESGINVLISTEKQRCELVRPRLSPALSYLVVTLSDDLCLTLFSRPLPLYILWYLLMRQGCFPNRTPNEIQICFDGRRFHMERPGPSLCSYLRSILGSHRKPFLDPI